MGLTTSGDAVGKTGGRAAGLPLHRWAAFLVLLLAEGLALGIGFDSDALYDLPPGLATAVIQHAGSAVRVGAVVFAALFLIAGARLRRGISPALAHELITHRPLPFVGLQLVCFGALVALTALLFRRHEANASANALIAAWLVALAATLASWGLILVPPRLVPRLARAYAPMLALAVAVGVVAAGLGKLSQGLWMPLRQVTFGLSSVLLGAVVREVVVDPARLAFGTRGFVVDIAPECSGYEGVGLTLAFLLVALWLFRDRLQFPRAWWLLAIGTVVPFVANIIRLVALVLVGAFVSPEIGAGGFHSYAGTLLFCGVALSIVALALRSPWLARPAAASAAGGPGAAAGLPPAAAPGHASDNPAAPYLVAFLALVVASLVSRAFSVGEREPLFFIRPLVGVIVLAIYWPTYRQSTWRPTWQLSWFAVPIGLLVAALWLGIDQLFPLPTDAGPPPPTPPAFTLAIRMVATLLVVPLAEELAFRGFLARRVSGPAFDQLSPRAISWVGLLLSSVAFGLLHQRLLAGVLAGLGYGLAYRLRGRLADAVVAHATTNAALVILAVLTGAWGLWM